MGETKANLFDRIASWASILVAALALLALVLVTKLFVAEQRVARNYQDAILRLVNDYNALAERTGQPERVRYIYERDGIAITPVRPPAAGSAPVPVTGTPSDLPFQMPVPTPTSEESRLRHALARAILSRTPTPATPIPTPTK